MSTTLKTTRKGPPSSATKHVLGTKRKGNDGNMWIIVETKNNIKRWKKIEKSTNKKSYLTHDNGSRPFMVVINNKTVSIFKVPKEFNDQSVLKKTDYTELVKTYTNINDIFIGKSVKGDDAYKSFSTASKASTFGLGNSILLQISGNRYVFIGDYVYEFKTHEPIEEFYSMIGRSDVPYPVVITSKNVYFLINGGKEGYLSREYFELFPKERSWALDSYEILWAKLPKSTKKKTKNIPNVKIIHKRI